MIGKRISYFRGRKLYGKRIKVPDRYRGVVLSTAKEKLPQRSQTPQDDEDEGEESISEVGVVEEKVKFEELVVWGHESLPDDTADAYIKGVEEWILFSEQVCQCALLLNQD
jgi:ribonuclease H2 subunit C